MFLYPGQAVIFALNDEVNAQIGLRAPVGSTNYKISYLSNEITLNSSVDMFYHNLTGQVAIANTGDNILSITKLKVFGVTAQYGSFEFEPLDEEQVTFALKRMIAVTESEEPELPEVPEGDEVAKVPESSGKPESNSKPATSTTPEDSKDPETSTEVEETKKNSHL